MINLKINGVPIQVEEGTTILEAAKKANIIIPSLCYNPDLPAWASCGICVVRVAGSPKLIRACTTPVDGMLEGKDIITHDGEIIATRRVVLEMILSNHPQRLSAVPPATITASCRPLRRNSAYANPLTKR